MGVPCDMLHGAAFTAPRYRPRTQKPGVQEPKAHGERTTRKLTKSRVRVVKSGSIAIVF